MYHQQIMQDSYEKNLKQAGQPGGYSQGPPAQYPPQYPPQGDVYGRNPQQGKYSISHIWV